jgi:hypothetical protein
LPKKNTREQRVVVGYTFSVIIYFHTPPPCLEGVSDEAHGGDVRGDGGGGDDELRRLAQRLLLEVIQQAEEELVIASNLSEDGEKQFTGGCGVVSCRRVASKAQKTDDARGGAGRVDGTTKRAQSAKLSHTRSRARVCRGALTLLTASPMWMARGAGDGTNSQRGGEGGVMQNYFFIVAVTRTRRRRVYRCAQRLCGTMSLTVSSTRPQARAHGRGATHESRAQWFESGLNLTRSTGL